MADRIIDTGTNEVAIPSNAAMCESDWNTTTDCYRTVQERVVLVVPDEFVKAWREGRA